jgi:predicted lipoprotein with Yx(FWY)xxD motif
MELVPGVGDRKPANRMTDMRSIDVLMRTFVFGIAILLGATGIGWSQIVRSLTGTPNETLGPYLSDQGGMALYMFEEDRPEGFRGRSVESDCIGECLARWPIFGGDPVPTAGEGIDPALIGSFVRPDGKTQAMYNGWPLYYFAEDFAPGDINGHDFEEFGGEWYLLDLAGNVIGDEDENRDRVTAADDDDEDDDDSADDESDDGSDG